MNNFWIIISIAMIVVLAIVVGIILRNRSRNDVEKVISGNSELVFVPGSADVESVKELGLTIPIELLPATTQFEGKKLFEITDSTVVARISELIPFTSQTGTRLIG